MTNEESLLRCYIMPVPEDAELRFEARDMHGRSASIQVTDFRLFLFANGMGILSFGVEAFDVPMSDALWINESLRKVYPSSGQQIREGRIPCDFSLVLKQAGHHAVLVQDVKSSRLFLTKEWWSILTSQSIRLQFQRISKNRKSTKFY